APAPLARHPPSLHDALPILDTVANLNRSLDRAAMREFEQRVLFQMGATDSSQLIDSPAASRLGLHRALLYSEESGLMEKFRPYRSEEHTSELQSREISYAVF